MIPESDLAALLSKYEAAPSEELRVQLLEEHYAASRSAASVYTVAEGRALLASEHRRADKACQAMVRIEAALSKSSSRPRLVAARARLAAVGT